MTVLAIIQARYGSTRLPGKMLLTLEGETLIARAWRLACETFGETNCVVAIPKNDAQTPLLAELTRIGARVFEWDGDEADVLGRFHACAHAYRWHPDTVIFRYTPDDPFKTTEMMKRVAAGERLPVEQGGEAFTLAMLDAANAAMRGDAHVRNREHITHALFEYPPPPPPSEGVWTIDTAQDLEGARR